MPGGSAPDEPLGRQHRADGEAAAEALRQRDRVAARAAPVAAEEAPEPTDARLHLVHEEQRARARRRATRSFARNPRGARQHAALALQRLHDDGAHVVAHLARHRVGVPVRHVRHRTERPEALAVLRRPGHRQRAERASVERVVERDDAHALLLAREVEVVARQLEHRLVRLRARVAEEGAVVARAAAQLVGEADVRRVVEVVGHVHQARRLLGDGAREHRVPVAHRAHGDAGAEVEPAAPVGVEHLAAATAHERERGRLVVGVEALAREGDEGVVFAHFARRASTWPAISAKPSPIGRVAT